MEYDFFMFFDMIFSLFSFFFSKTKMTNKKNMEEENDGFELGTKFDTDKRKIRICDGDLRMKLGI